MTIDVYNPRNGAIIDSVPAHTAPQTDEAITKARHAQLSWAATPVEQRCRIGMKIHDGLLRNQRALLDMIQQETGKDRSSAFDEVMDAAINARYYAKRSAKLLQPQTRKGALPFLTKTKVDYSPKGVVGIISPWNYPLTLTISDAVPALLAGNAVVLKPDSQTPLTALLAREIALEAGVPSEVYQVVTGAGSEVGTALAEAVDFLMFTGSTATGRILGAIAGRRLIGFSAELGGKNPLIVTRKADIGRAVRGTIAGAFTNTGQLCVSIERIYVHEEIASQYCKQLVQAVEKLRIGTGGWSEDIGSMISAEHAAKVLSLVDDALSHGAKKLCGGPREDLGPAFLAPIVLTDVPQTAKLYREEVFGPVVAIETFTSDFEAIMQANDTEYGLNAAVFGPTKTSWRIGRQLHSGTVNINEGFAAAFGSVDAPMGGWKDSGTGRRHSEAGLLKYTEARTIAQQRLMPISGPAKLPKAGYAQIMTALLRAGKRIL